MCEIPGEVPPPPRWVQEQAGDESEMTKVRKVQERVAGLAAAQKISARFKRAAVKEECPVECNLGKERKIKYL